ncbi:hypothetical protein QO002_003338 [Pararhizobium capsulatum DSM 1112]|uniref:Uncharacterized protein n=1 Tax=Pararhizobium capsulatum DSM 1112 TaxID=1121113 RepID=A0ABU0BUQ9_9HYPH|nr:hypothetical protein [Pararhizobium capsulatum DSM 1112]
MSLERSNERRAGFLARLSAGETVVLAIIAMIALAGTLLIGKGLYMKAKAELSQVLLQRSFAAELRGETGAKPWPWADFTTEAEITAPRLGKRLWYSPGPAAKPLPLVPPIFPTRRSRATAAPPSLPPIVIHISAG